MDDASRSKALLRKALDGTLAATERAAAWRLFLGVADDPAETRQRYERLQQLHLPDVSAVSANDDSDPLSMMTTTSSASSDKDSAWSRYYATADLREEIQKDLDRLSLNGIDEANFLHEAQRSMLVILTVWASMYAEVGYRQGMHEVLGLVVVACEAEGGFAGWGPAASANCFAVFEALMKTHKAYFSTVSGVDSPVLVLCRRAQTTALEAVDPALAAHLASCESVEPQLYGLRWTRLLFLREFDAHGVLVIWDALFALFSASSEKQSSSARWVGDKEEATQEEEQGFDEILGDFVVVLLVSVRLELLRGDDMDCLSLLMRFSGLTEPRGALRPEDVAKRAVKLATSPKFNRTTHAMLAPAVVEEAAAPLPTPSWTPPLEEHPATARPGLRTAPPRALFSSSSSQNPRQPPPPPPPRITGPLSAILYGALAALEPALALANATTPDTEVAIQQILFVADELRSSEAASRGRRY